MYFYCTMRYDVWHLSIYYLLLFKLPLTVNGFSPSGLSYEAKNDYCWKIPSLKDSFDILEKVFAFLLTAAHFVFVFCFFGVFFVAFPPLLAHLIYWQNVVIVCNPLLKNKTKFYIESSSNIFCSCINFVLHKYMQK